MGSKTVRSAQLHQPRALKEKEEKKKNKRRSDCCKP